MPPGPIEGTVVTLRRPVCSLSYLVTRPTPWRWCGRRGRWTLCLCWQLCFCPGFTRVEHLGLQLTPYLPRRNQSSPEQPHYTTSGRFW